jgi:thiol-disulfide isomerase/thioredoxin
MTCVRDRESFPAPFDAQQRTLITRRGEPVRGTSVDIESMRATTDFSREPRPTASMRTTPQKPIFTLSPVPFVTLVLCALSTFASTQAWSAPLADLGELKGKVVLVDFWASWCVPCRHSFPWMNEMQKKYGAQGLQIIGVNLDDDKKAADKFLRETPASFTLKFDPAGTLARKFDVQTMPSSYLLDASGNVIAKHFGFKLTEADAYEAQIKTALATR